MRDAMGNRVCGDLRSMVRSVRVMIRTKTTVLVKIADYITC